MRKSDKKSIPTKYILFILSFLCMVLIVLSFIMPGFASPVKEGVSYMLVPVSKGMNQVGRWFNDRKDDLSELRDVMAENTELKAQIADLQNKNALSVEERSELEELRTLFQLSEQYSSYETVAGRIISRDSSNWFSTFTIDKGKKDGIEVDMNVIGDGGPLTLLSSSIMERTRE